MRMTRERGRTRRIDNKQEMRRTKRNQGAKEEELEEEP